MKRLNSKTIQKWLPLELEVKQMEKLVMEKKLAALRKRKEMLKKQIEEVELLEKDATPEVLSRKRPGKSTGTFQKVGSNSGWEGLIDDTGVSDDDCDRGKKSKLPPFEVIASMFTDASSGKKRKSMNKVEVDDKDSSESEDDDAGSQEGSGAEDSEVVSEDDKGKKTPLKSGIFASATSTKIVKSILHAQAMVDEDETLKNAGFKFHELPFALLVAGEMEIILSKASPEEKWTRLNLMKKLAYKAVFLDNKSILDQYAAFLGKVEKGKIKWGSSKAIKSLDEKLRFRTLMASLHTKEPEGGKVMKYHPERIRDGNNEVFT